LKLQPTYILAVMLYLGEMVPQFVPSRLAGSLFDKEDIT
jgi:hypothetical protein